MANSTNSTKLDLSKTNVSESIMSLGKSSSVTANSVTVIKKLPAEYYIKMAEKAQNTISQAIISDGENAKVNVKDIRIELTTSDAASTLTTDGIGANQKVIFQVKDAQIAVKKAKLVEKAPEFAKSCNVDELKENEIVQLDNEDPEVFKAVVSHINTDKVDEDIKLKYCSKLIKSAIKYEIPSLESEMDKFTESSMSPPPYQVNP